MKLNIRFSFLASGIFFSLISSLSSWAQTDPVKPPAKKINLSHVSVVAPTDLNFKTLTLEYMQVKDKKTNTVMVEGKACKWFASKGAALEAFEKEKETAEKETTYVINSADKTKKPEAITYKLPKAKVVEVPVTPVP